MLYSDSSPMSADKWCKTFNALEANKRLAKPDCPICKGKGLIAAPIEENGNVYIGARPCACVGNTQNKRRAERSGLGDLLRRYTLESYETEHTWQYKAKNKAVGYIKNDDDGWFVMTGKPGSGKTHLCAAICGELLKAGKSVVYMPWREIAPRLKAMVTDYKEYDRAMWRYMNAEILYIDDFFKGNVTEADVNLAYEILNKRYMNSKTKARTIISSEKSLGEITSIDEAIGSRIAERCTGYWIDTPPENHRLTARG